MSVVYMINNNSSSCPNCMVLICKIVLQSLINNVRIFAKHVPGKENRISDALSRLNFKEFGKYTEDLNFEEINTGVPEDLWPMEKIWLPQA